MEFSKLNAQLDAFAILLPVRVSELGLVFTFEVLRPSENWITLSALFLLYFIIHEMYKQPVAEQSLF